MEDTNKVLLRAYLTPCSSLPRASFFFVSGSSESVRRSAPAQSKIQMTWATLELFNFWRFAARSFQHARTIFRQHIFSFDKMRKRTELVVGFLKCQLFQRSVHLYCVIYVTLVTRATIARVRVHTTQSPLLQAKSIELTGNQA